VDKVSHILNWGGRMIKKLEEIRKKLFSSYNLTAFGFVSAIIAILSAIYAFMKGMGVLIPSLLAFGICILALGFNFYNNY